MELKNIHSKMDNIQYDNLSKQPYLSSSIFFPEQANILFKFRMYMVEVKNNFENMFRHDILCPLCKVKVDTQDHLLACEKLHEAPLKEVNYDDIFSKNTMKQIKAILALKKSLEERRKILDNEKENENDTNL